MNRTMRYATWITGIAAGTLLVATPAAAVTNSPARDETSQRQTTIQRLDVPVAVPVDDTTNEAAQMTIAAALGAAVSAAARRRRSSHLPAARRGISVIDITETVLHRQAGEESAGGDRVAAGHQPTRGRP